MKKSTQQKKKDAAMTEALRLEAAETKAGTATDEHATKAFAILKEAAEAAARSELSEGRTRELLARLCELSTGESLRFYTVAQWRDEWLAVRAATSKKASNTLYKTHVDAFDWLGDKASARQEAVTKADVRGFRDAIRAGWMSGEKDPKGRDPKTLRTAKTTNLYAADVAGMFRHAMKDGLILSNPAAALARLPESDAPNVRFSQ